LAKVFTIHWVLLFITFSKPKKNIPLFISHQPLFNNFFSFFITIKIKNSLKNKKFHFSIQKIYNIPPTLYHIKSQTYENTNFFKGLHKKLTLGSQKYKSFTNPKLILHK
jgi:hypothetical protein